LREQIVPKKGLSSDRLIYNGVMARGWESKAVEEQVASAQHSRDQGTRSQSTRSDLQQLRRSESLLMERRRLLREMEQGQKKRYLVLLERALAHIDAELAKSDGEPD
jgi:hypothetical protein